MSDSFQSPVATAQAAEPSLPAHTPYVELDKDVVADAEEVMGKEVVKISAV